LEDRRLRLIEVRQALLRQAITPSGVLQELLVDVAVAALLTKRHADLGTASAHLGRDDDNGHGSPPPILVSNGRRCDRDAFARDASEAVPPRGDRAAGEDFEDVERGLERAVGPLGHHRVYRGYREPCHAGLPEVAARLADAPGLCNVRRYPARRSARSIGGGEDEASGARSNAGTNEEAGHGPGGTPAPPPPRDAPGAIPAGKPAR